MTLAVLLDNITDIVGFPSLLKLSTSHEILDLPDRPNSVSVRLCQPKKQENAKFRLTNYNKDKLFSSPFFSTCAKYY